MPDFREPEAGPRRWEAIMKLDISPEETDLLKILLLKDVEETRVEVHHAKNIDYKAHLQAREKVLQSLMERLQTST